MVLVAQLYLSLALDQGNLEIQRNWAELEVEC
jgi:hypothetical protein